MKCTRPDLGVLAEGYGFGEIAQDMKEAFELHLLECDGCREAVTLAEDLRDTMRQSAKGAAGADLPLAGLPYRWRVVGEWVRGPWLPRLVWAMAGAAAASATFVIVDRRPTGEGTTPVVALSPDTRDGASDEGGGQIARLSGDEPIIELDLLEGNATNAGAGGRQRVRCEEDTLKRTDSESDNNFLEIHDAHEIVESRQGQHVYLFPTKLEAGAYSFICEGEGTGGEYRFTVERKGPRP